MRNFLWPVRCPLFLYIHVMFSCTYMSFHLYTFWCIFLCFNMLDIFGGFEYEQTPFDFDVLCLYNVYNVYNLCLYNVLLWHSRQKLSSTNCSQIFWLGDGFDFDNIKLDISYRMYILISILNIYLAHTLISMRLS